MNKTLLMIIFIVGFSMCGLNSQAQANPGAPAYTLPATNSAPATTTGTSAAPTSSLRPNAREDHTSESENTSETPNTWLRYGQGYAVKLQEPIGDLAEVHGSNGVQILSLYVAAIYKYLAAIVGLFAVTVMVVSGVQIQLAGFDQGLVDDAKKRITASLISLVMLFGSALLLTTINPDFFGGAGFGILWFSL